MKKQLEKLFSVAQFNGDEDFFNSIEQIINGTYKAKNPSAKSIKDFHYGIIENLFLDKVKPDMNGYFGNLSMIKNVSKDIKEAIQFACNNNFSINDYSFIIFEKLDNDWHWKLIRRLKKIDKEKLETYQILF